ncbi:hypothetical protein [Sphingomonas arenae]|uniref:hypothetical protein n=1 Tax=Sphingomonas arenae TaxID=2812555 RepID=UPI001967824B|nr:hypothetical protein [Sphingomonas arenae]
MPFEVDEVEAQSGSRLALVALVGLNLRMMENWRRTQLEAWGETLDYESTMILLAVIAIGGERLTRTSLTPDFRDLACPVPMELLGKCNVTSIAAATGLNRETVRRKVQRLERKELLIRDGKRSFRIVPAIMQSDMARELVRSQLEALRRTMNHLSRAGIFRSRTKTRR